MWCIDCGHPSYSTNHQQSLFLLLRSSDRSYPCSPSSSSRHRGRDSTVFFPSSLKNEETHNTAQHIVIKKGMHLICICHSSCSQAAERALRRSYLVLFCSRFAKWDFQSGEKQPTGIHFQWKFNPLGHSPFLPSTLLRDMRCSCSSKTSFDPPSYASGCWNNRQFHIEANPSSVMNKFECTPISFTGGRRTFKGQDAKGYAL